MSQPLMIVGAGGHGREALTVARAVGRWNPITMVDDGAPDALRLARIDSRITGTIENLVQEQPRGSAGSPSGNPLTEARLRWSAGSPGGNNNAGSPGGNNNAGSPGGNNPDHVIAIGDPRVRRRVAERIGDRLTATVLVDPSAWIGSDVELAPGAMVYPGSICTTNVRIGHHSHLNCGVIVSHDCRVGDFVSLSPGVMLNGGVVIEDGAFLGTGAIVLPGCRVGQGATIGAGSVVRDDVRAGTTVVGVPAHRVEREISVIAT